MTTNAADAETAEGRVYNVGGADWDEVVAGAADPSERSGEEHIVVNMGPQHPSTHGVLRLILTLDGETVTELRPVIGYLHTGIEKNMEFRTWTQGVTFITRADYLMPLFNEAAYCLAVERLLGIEDRIPDRANVIRVLMMELNRISSHLTGIGPFGLELGATTVFLYGIREREKVLDLFELITGLRMNHALHPARRGDRRTCRPAPSRRSVSSSRSCPGSSARYTSSSTTARRSSPGPRTSRTWT